MRSNRILHLVLTDERRCEICNRYVHTVNRERESVTRNSTLYREAVSLTKSFSTTKYIVCSTPVTRMFNDVVNLEGFKL